MRRIVLGLVLAGFMFAVFAAASPAKTVWLCRPGQTPDPCASGLSTTVYTPALQRLRVEHPKPVRAPSIDCFYVYPAVADTTPASFGSGSYGPVKGKKTSPHIDPEQRSIAIYQAARFSQYCRVYAPVYHLNSSTAIRVGGRPNLTAPYLDVRDALATYLKHYNRGRGFVLIGSGEGASVLGVLIHQYLDPHPRLRSQLVSAILEGSNGVVERGSGIGGLRHIPACHSARQLGCVIAFTIFDQPVPPVTHFGRPTRAMRQRHESLLCTNPARLGGGSGRLDPIFPSQPSDPRNLISQLMAGFELALPHPGTAWIAEPGAYRARCSAANHASVVEITPLSGAHTPVPNPDPAYGLHFIGLNLALGNLISIVKHEAAAYVRRHGSP